MPSWSDGMRHLCSTSAAGRVSDAWTVTDLRSASTTTMSPLDPTTATPAGMTNSRSGQRRVGNTSRPSSWNKRTVCDALSATASRPSLVTATPAGLRLYQPMTASDRPQRSNRWTRYSSATTMSWLPRNVTATGDWIIPWRTPTCVHQALTRYCCTQHFYTLHSKFCRVV